MDKDKINIGVFNPNGINCLCADSRLSVIPIYIDVDDKTRLIRQLNREESPNCHEICRRFFADEQDFNKEKYDFDFYAYDNSGEIDLYQIMAIIKYDGFNIGED